MTANKRSRNKKAPFLMCLIAEKVGAIQLPYASSRYIMGHIGQCR